MKYFALIAIALILFGSASIPLHHASAAPTPSVQLSEAEEQENENDTRERPSTVSPTPAPTVNQKNTVTPTNSTNVVTPTTNVNTVVPVRTLSVSTNFPWAWMVIRASGIASFLLLALITVLGTMLTTGLFFRIASPSTAWSIHRAVASALLISVLTHVVSLLLDNFIGMRLIDVLIPFASRFRPLFVALGVIGFYLLLLILGSSLYMMQKYARFWRIVHYLGFVMFVNIFLHGIFTGTDTKQWWMQAIYWTAGIVVGLFSAYRVIWKIRTPATKRARATSAR